MFRLALAALALGTSSGSIVENCKLTLASLRGEGDLALAARCHAAFAPAVCKAARQSLGAQPWSSERISDSCGRLGTSLGSGGALDRALAQKSASESVTGDMGATMQETQDKLEEAGGQVQEQAEKAKDSLADATDAKELDRALAEKAASGNMEGKMQETQDKLAEAGEQLQEQAESAKNSLADAKESALDRALAQKGASGNVESMTGDMEGKMQETQDKLAEAGEQVQGKAEEQAENAAQSTISDAKDSVKLFSQDGSAHQSSFGPTTVVAFFAGMCATGFVAAGVVARRPVQREALEE